MNRDDTQTPPRPLQDGGDVTASAALPKRTYAPPQLKLQGRVATLTKSIGSGAFDFDESGLF